MSSQDFFDKHIVICGLPKQEAEEVKETIKEKLGEQLAWAIVETLNGNYKLKTLAAADKAGDSIEQELFGTKEEAREQFKQHLKELKKGGYFEN